jgi:hypothetical protein
MKIKTAKFSKEARVAGETPMRRTSAQPSGLYLLALRSHAAHVESLVPRPKLVIRIEPKGVAEGQAEPVRINHA